MEETGDEGCGKGIFKGGKQGRVARSGALEVLPFKLKGALQANEGGLGIGS